jgi:hypothetical protein
MRYNRNMFERRRLLAAGIATGLIMAATYYWLLSPRLPSPMLETPRNQWQFASIDTMKQSLDEAHFPPDREKIAGVVSEVKALGATHVAISTPYDLRYDNVLKIWVSEIRKQKLKVWFRGGFASFSQDHTTTYEKTKEFVKRNQDLFETGDKFSAMKEPDVFIKNPKVLDEFILNSYEASKEAFTTLKNEKGIVVDYGYMSLLGDAALKVDPQVVKYTGNTIVIDHYISDPALMGKYIQSLIDRYGPDVKIVIGEFGGPHREINGPMDEEQQAQFVDALFREIVRPEFKNNIIGVNYWHILNTDQLAQSESTALINPDGSRRKAAGVVEKYFRENLQINQ